MRERNVLLVAGGYAPVFPERSLDAPELAVAEAARHPARGHKPYPAFAVDRHWNIVASNSALPQLFDGVDPALLARPVNALRLSLHPEGLGPRIVNFGRVACARGRPPAPPDRPHRRRGAHRAAGRGPQLRRAQPGRPRPAPAAAPQMVVPFRVRIGDEVCQLLHHHHGVRHAGGGDLSELALESFFPADAETAALVRRLSALPPA